MALVMPVISEDFSLMRLEPGETRVEKESEERTS
jgi:hypothetical protein